MKTVQVILLLLVFTAYTHAGLIDEAYVALKNNDLVSARKHLKEAYESEDTKVEAGMLLLLLNNIEGGKESNFELFSNLYDDIPDISEYMFPIWFDEAIMSNFGRKEPKRVNFFLKMLGDERLNGSTIASLQYGFGFHFMVKKQFSDARNIWEKVSNVNEWQFVGPFENASGSGFNLEYGPNLNPQPESKFTSMYNSEIQWFTPKHMERDPWITPDIYIAEQEYIIYAQSFVNSEIEQDVILGFGATGTFKVWLNDKEIITEQVEQITELDVFRYNVHLNKGVNRVLVKIGKTNNLSASNFLVRFIDDNGFPLKNVSSSTEYKSYEKNNNESLSEPISHFAETFFEKQIKEQPTSSLYPILLSKVYYRRSLYSKAIEILKEYKTNHGTDILVEYELLLNYINLGNRTELINQLEHIRKIAPSLIFFKIFDYNELISQENFDAAEIKLEEIEAYLGKDNFTCMTYRIELSEHKNDYKGFVDLIDEMYKLYPDESTSVLVKYYLVKNLNKQPKKAIKMLENLLKENYHEYIVSMLVADYNDIGATKKSIKLLEEYIANYPASTSTAQSLVSIFYSKGKYKEALLWNDYCIGNSPYHSSFWMDRAYIHEAMGNKEAAIEDLKKVVNSNPNQFAARERLRELSGKNSILALLQSDDDNKIIENEITKDLKTDISSEYIYENKTLVLFKEGASIYRVHSAIRIYNTTGINDWKEVHIGYNPYRQRLVIEQAMILKKDGKKIKAEQSASNLVFPSLEVGDILLVDYHLENYVWGKFSRDFWDEYSFSNYIPTNNSTLKLYLPKGYDLKFKSTDSNATPQKETFEEFDVYKWSFEFLPEIEFESMMPAIQTVGQTINTSSLDDWSVLSEWYRDIATSNSVDNYIIDDIYNEIFKDGLPSSDFDKAYAIYNYIEDNINYSFVPFRQSNYIPQKPMITASTKLGDCKDLSLLYHVLAKKAGLKTNLVLVKTRNTRESLVLPAFDFNHCIIKIDIDGNPIYQELTDKNLPFGAMSTDLENSQALEIPNSISEQAPSQLISIQHNGSIPNYKKRTTHIKCTGNKLNINTTATCSGDMASNARHTFIEKPEDETTDELREFFQKYYEKDFKLTEYSLDSLENRNTPLKIHTTIEIENDVKVIGGLSMLKVPFYDEIVSLKNLPEKERKFPILYWVYENNNFYEDEIIISLPKTSNIIEIPADVVINEKFIDYELKSEQIDDYTVKVTRTATIKETELSKDYYPKLREVIKTILKHEDAYVVFKQL